MSLEAVILFVSGVTSGIIIRATYDLIKRIRQNIEEEL